MTQQLPERAGKATIARTSQRSKLSPTERSVSPLDRMEAYVKGASIGSVPPLDALFAELMRSRPVGTNSSPQPEIASNTTSGGDRVSSLVTGVEKVLRTVNSGLSFVEPMTDPMDYLFAEPLPETVPVSWLEEVRRYGGREDPDLKLPWNREDEPEQER